MIDIDKDMIFLKDKFVQCFMAGREHTLEKFQVPSHQEAKDAALEFVENVIIGKPEDKQND